MNRTRTRKVSPRQSGIKDIINEVISWDLNLEVNTKGGWLGRFNKRKTRVDEEMKISFHS